MKLYNFFRSSTSHRLRIALKLKGMATDYVAVDLRVDEQQRDAFKAVNPQGLVPALDTGEKVMVQSTAIIEWLEETHPLPALLPTGADARAHVRALASIVGCDIHPVNNRRILQTLRKQFGANEEAINAWCGTWISEGFDAYEALIAADTSRGRFSFGDTPTLADVYLIPQVESARRFNVDMARWPLISAIDQACSELDAFKSSVPMAQPDA
ncbi:maleylacetoacetate isomerase [Limnohabitans sp. Jir72]|uniref:maleylacetoacetate isomerase n=1 Tax=Limnohabitans sp. Jir72 TaxID=1977909 RepID=UPI000D347151|nr:maleylacetoacetate isomerase [Limnohabitans sp. Jir72]PUE31600.1 maleylacetoacetate isomerase [Limnohabitans sp. Jir72]